MSFAAALSLVSLVVSFTSLGASHYTLWIVHLRRGDLKMTQPTMLFLGRDQGPQTPKVWLRTLLFSTSTRVQIIENMFLRVHPPGAAPQTFDFWVYGEKEKMSRGSGLFVSQSGVVCDNHFMLRREAGNPPFLAGAYKVEVLASVLGKSHPDRLMQLQFALDAYEPSGRRRSVLRLEPRGPQLCRAS